jgi:hypothetical protein
VGSGLILLIIVGAWLAFFVQMALRSESTDVLGTVDRFHDAMRVLSRRQAAAGPREQVRGRPGPGPDPGPGTPAPVPAPRRTSAVAGPALATSPSGAGEDAARRRASAAARRAKLLAGLAVTAVLTLLGAVTLSWWLLALHVLVDLLLVGLVVHVRTLSRSRAAADQRVADALARDRAARSPELAARTAGARPVQGSSVQGSSVQGSSVRVRLQGRAAEAGSVEVRRPVPVVRRPVQIHVAGVPDRMPPRPRPLSGSVGVPAPLPVPAARTGQAPLVRQVRGAQGEAWSPVPVPAPTYLSAPPAPRRVVDLTRPAGAVERRAGTGPEVGLHDVAPAAEEAVDHRWAVND